MVTINKLECCPHIRILRRSYIIIEINEGVFNVYICAANLEKSIIIVNYLERPYLRTSIIHDSPHTQKIRKARLLKLPFLLSLTNTVSCYLSFKILRFFSHRGCQYCMILPIWWLVLKLLFSLLLTNTVTKDIESSIQQGLSHLFKAGLWYLHV